MSQLHAMFDELAALTNTPVGGSVAVAEIALEHADWFRAVSAEPEAIQRILDVTATVERFGVTFLGAGIHAAEAGEFNQPVPAPIIAILKAARAQEMYHLQFFERAGGRPFVDTFTIPHAALRDYGTFFRAIVTEETAEIASQLAAIRTYVTLRRPDLTKVGYQFAAQEAEHRVLANMALGAVPGNDSAFAPIWFDKAEDIMASFKQRGLIEGNGQPVPFPGPGEIDTSNVIETIPGGPVAQGC
jgi:hypothetical protein